MCLICQFYKINITYGNVETASKLTEAFVSCLQFTVTVTRVK